MEKTDDVVAILGKILNDKTFLASMMKEDKFYSSREMEDRLGTIIKYYIATRDSHIGYTYEEIASKYGEIAYSNLEPGTELYRNTVTHGFLTHSFNGYKKDRIMQYGLNYMENIKDEETMAEIQGVRGMLQKLESLLEKSEYVHEKHLANEVFLTAPGTKTAYYACKNAPERLYLGPLNGYEDEPMVVGETKQTYMLRVLTKKIQQKYPDTNSHEYMESLKLAKDVTEYFCSKPPAVAFLSTEKIKDIPVSSNIYKPEDAVSLEKMMTGCIEGVTTLNHYTIKGEKGLKYSQHYRVKETGKEVEPIISEEYDWDSGEYKKTITAYRVIGTGKEISPDEVEITTSSQKRHIYSNDLQPKIRLKESEEEVEPITGEYRIKISEDEILEVKEEELEPVYNEFPLDHIFSYTPGDQGGDLGNIATLAQYIPNGAISGVIDMVDEFEIKQLFARNKGMKAGDLIDYGCSYKGEPSIEQLLDAITSNSTEEDLEELRRKFEKLKQPRSIEQDISDLEAKKQEILARQYNKKEGISAEYTLSDVLTEFEQNGLMENLLEQDTTIEQDELQYTSNTHGVRHTRRVNFLAMAIMNLENVQGRDREIILEIVKNHDIGRTHDFEDSQHGKDSVDKINDNEGRLEGFNPEEQELIKFVIVQHSKSQKENKQAIRELPEELRQRYSRILDIFKDADKLDRVRLDPEGLYPREGLDATRLSLETSKKLEGVAYEAYDKILEILDVEKQKQAILEEPKKEEKIELDVEFERRMQEAQEAIEARKMNERNIK